MQQRKYFYSENFQTLYGSYITNTINTCIQILKIVRMECQKSSKTKTMYVVMDYNNIYRYTHSCNLIFNLTLHSMASKQVLL